MKKEYKNFGRVKNIHYISKVIMREIKYNIMVIEKIIPAEHRIGCENTKGMLMGSLITNKDIVPIIPFLLFLKTFNIYLTLEVW